MKNIINMLKRGDELMPLTMIDEGTPYTIQRIGGFVPGAVVTVVSKAGGNVIVNIKESRVAIGKDMANKIMV